MSKTFNIRASMGVIRDSVPIRFTHRKSMDKPENHVMHLNNYVEIYVFISGNHNFIVDNSLYELHRGDIVVINSRTVHKALPLCETMYERFYFLVDEHTFDCMHLNPLAQILNKPASIGNLISPNEKKRKEILQMLYAISDCFENGRDDQLSAFGYFMRILDEINKQMNHEHSHGKAITYTPPLLEKILAYVTDHVAEIQAITEISSALGLTPQYLSSYFSKHVGTPLKTYIQAQKIALAKTLLDKGTDVTQACYDCGFNDCSYFIRVFKKYVRMTPLAYKQKNGR